MEFNHPKLPKEAASKLRICPIHTVKPYALMLAPVYVFMRRNEKFVAVKSPLDFFTTKELQRLAPLESFFFPEFVDSVLPFRSAARAVRALLSWQPHAGFSPKGELSIENSPLPPAPYELSDAILRIIGPLWGRRAASASAPADLAIEPFFISVFANELCDPLPPDVLVSSRDRSLIDFERALFESGWAVFFALHLGYSDLAFLNELRIRILERSVNGTPVGQNDNGELDEIIALASESLAAKGLHALSGTYFSARPERVSQKLASRMKRIATEFIGSSTDFATIFGEKGFAHV